MRCRLAVLLLLIALLPLLAQETDAQPNELAGRLPRLDDSAQVSLVTYTPGEELYQAFGHSAIRVKDDLLSIDRLYNFGVFDFETADFYLKFVHGDLLYQLAVSTGEEEISIVGAYGQGITELLLNLSQDQKQKLFEVLEINLLPENRFYRYDFILDNCSTRPRDVLERITGSPVIERGAGNQTFRQMLDPYFTRIPWIGFGISLLLGAKVDRLASPREACFLPADLERAVQTGKDGDQSLTAGKKELFPPEALPDSSFFLAPIWIFYSGGILWLLFWLLRGKGHAVWPTALSLTLFGLTGTFLLVVSLWTRVWVLPSSCRHVALFHQASTVFASMVSAVRVCCRVRLCGFLIRNATEFQSCNLSAITHHRLAMFPGAGPGPIRYVIMKPALLHVLAIFLSLVGGVLVSLAFPPWNQDWLIWIGFTPVLAGVLLFPRGWIASLIHGAIFGGTFGGLVFSWLLAGGRANDWMWNFLSLMLLGGIWGIFVGLFVQLPASSANQRVSPILPGYGFNSAAWTKSISHLRAALVTASAWTVLEWGRGVLIPEWNAVGTVLQANLPLFQIATITGVSGLSFVAVFANVIALTTVRRIVLEPGRMTWASRFDVTATLGVIFVAALAGFWSLQHQPARERIKIGLFCPDTTDFERLLELSEGVNEKGIDLFVWRCVRLCP